MWRYIRRRPIHAAILCLVLAGAAWFAYNSVPHHMDEIPAREQELRTVLRPGVPIEEARSNLAAHRIEYYEYHFRPEYLHSYSSEWVHQNFKEGDTIIQGMVRTRAGDLACKYGIDFYGVFGSDQKLRGVHLDRMQLCM